jgi:hypothetical protein
LLSDVGPDDMISLVFWFINCLLCASYSYLFYLLYNLFKNKADKIDAVRASSKKGAGK